MVTYMGSIQHILQIITREETSKVCIYFKQAILLMNISHQMPKLNKYTWPTKVDFEFLLG